MASTIPEQYRAVDPFASYNSNTVNQLTELRSRGENVLDIPCGLDVVEDATSASSVVVKPGYVFKDDVMIYVSEEHTVDFSDIDNQYISFELAEYVAGTYYIVLEYTFIKSRPAPQANIKIVMPNQRNFYDYGNSSTSLVFLKSVVLSSTIPVVIDSVNDYDLDEGIYIDNKRTFAKSYAGSEINFDPAVHDECEDRGRFAYDVTKDQFYFGLEDRWEPLNIAGTFNIDTDNLTVGDLAYVGSAGEAAAAIVTSINTAAEMIVVEVGTSALGTGQVRLSGYVQDVNVESTSPGVIIGDLLYLSDSEAGTVTSDQPDPLYQVVGRALSVEAASKVDILFFGRAVQETNTVARIRYTINSWTGPDGSGDYYHDVPIVDLGLSDRDVVVSCKDIATDRVIQPGDVDLAGTGGATTVRIWMPTSSINLIVAIVG
jgi:hypothetical protein